MSWLTAKLAGYAAAIGGVLALLLTIFYKGKKSGRKEVKDAVNAKTTEVVIETVKKEKKIDQAIESTPTDKLRDKLRQDWSGNSDTE